MDLITGISCVAGALFVYAVGEIAVVGAMYSDGGMYRRRHHPGTWREKFADACKCLR